MNCLIDGCPPLALASLDGAGVCLVVSLVLFFASAALFVAAWRKWGAKPPAAGPAQPAAPAPAGDEEPAPLLQDAAIERSTLMKLATFQDAESLREVAVRETGQMLGAVAVCLYRHNPDGTTPLCLDWRESKDYGRLPADVALESETPDYLDSHPFILYSKGQKEGNNPKWDELLGRAGAGTILAGTLRVDGEVWGHVSYFLKERADVGRDMVERLHEACALVQVGLSRAGVLETRESHQRQLASAARSANRAARAKTLFLATMSHEIRTPLNALVGFSEFLSDPNISHEEIKEYTEGISQSAAALLTLVNDVLDLSKLESGKVDMSGRCDLVSVFGELARIFRYRARTKAISIESHIDPSFPALQISEEHLRQILINIVGNAVKFTENGSVEWSAEAKPDGGGTVALHITVKDTGCGIPPEKLARIFDPFGDDGATRGEKAYSGSGLGLPIVKRLLESCNGTISINSTVGEGTEVYIRIGRLAVADAKEETTEKVGPLLIPKDFSVLIVDDVPVNLKVLSLRVKKMGVPDVILAGSGEEALRKMSDKRPNLVLTDMWMPGLNGAELAAAIRGDAATNMVPIVAVTADSDARSSFDMSNFSGMITKPVSVDKLRSCIAGVVRGKRAA